MDPTFAALLNDLKAGGFTDAMFANWLSGLDATEWERRVRMIDGWLRSGKYTQAQLDAIKAAPSWEAAVGTVDKANAPAPAPTPTTPTTPTPTPAPTTPTTPAGPTPEEQASAFASIRKMLDEFGLGGLADWAWGRYQAGFSIDQIMVEMYQRPEFKAVFPEYEDLAKRGRAQSVASLVEYRKQVVGMMRMYGIPEGFYDSVDDLSNLARNEVSLAEVSRRVSEAADAAYSSSPLMRAEMERLYGVNPGSLIAYFLDPDKAEPIIRQNWLSAQVGAASRQTGYGLLTEQEASSLAGLGVDYNAATRGFGTLAGSQELFNAVASNEQTIGRETQLGAAFGSNAADQQTVERRRGQRLAEFSQGGGFATTREGTTV